jgi:hypothetical protein
LQIAQIAFGGERFQAGNKAVLLYPVAKLLQSRVCGDGIGLKPLARGEGLYARGEGACRLAIYRDDARLS